MVKILEKVNKIILGALLIVLPISVSGLFVNNFDLPKLIILLTLTTLAILVFIMEVVVKSKFEFKISSIDLPLLIFTLTFVISGVISTQNKAEAFAFPGIATGILLIFLAYILIKKAFDSSKRDLLVVIAVSATLASLVSIFSFLGVFTSIPQLPAFMKVATFSTFGGKLPEVIFLISTVILNIYLAISEKVLVKKVFYTATSAIVILAIILGISVMLPGKPAAPVLVSFATSWWVAIETLKTYPIFGIGTGNYLTAFSKFLPVTYNSSAVWAARFSTGRSFVLTLITENGLLGFISFITVMFFVLKNSINTLKNNLDNFSLEQASSICLLIISVLFFIYPVNLTLIILFFVLIYLSFTSHDVSLNLSAVAHKNGNILTSRIPAIIVGLVVFVALGFLSYLGTKVTLAEHKYKLAIDALIKNDGKTTYDVLRQAITINPYIDRYHATYAQVNLALARSIAQKKDITDAEKNTVAQLIQQAIREAKTTVTLNSQRASNWELLASTYAATIPFAQGADNFAIQSYTQAISFDPVNPNLRISLGGVYYSLGKYDNAIDTFKLAILAKGNLANAHYNLAIAYREKKDFDNAIEEMNTVVSFVTKDSSDYKLAMTTLADLKKNKPTKETSTDNLQAPQSAQKPAITPPVELPEDATPPTQ